MDRTRPEIFALPARRVRESAGLAKAFGVGSAMRGRIAFNRGANPESGARTRTHSEGPAATGQKGKPLDASTFQSNHVGLAESAAKIKAK